MSTSSTIDLRARSHGQWAQDCARLSDKRTHVIGRPCDHEEVLVGAELDAIDVRPVGRYTMLRLHAVGCAGVPDHHLFIISNRPEECLESRAPSYIL